MVPVLFFGRPVVWMRSSAIHLLCFFNPDVKSYSLAIYLNGVGEKVIKKKKAGRRTDLKALPYDPQSPLVGRLLSPKVFCKSQGGGVQTGLLLLLLSLREGLPRAENEKQVQMYSKDLAYQLLVERLLQISARKWRSPKLFRAGAPKCSSRAVYLCAEPKLKCFVRHKCFLPD